MSNIYRGTAAIPNAAVHPEQGHSTLHVSQEVLDEKARLAMDELREWHEVNNARAAEQEANREAGQAPTTRNWLGKIGLASTVWGVTTAALVAAETPVTAYMAEYPAAQEMTLLTSAAFVIGGIACLFKSWRDKVASAR